MGNRYDVVFFLQNEQRSARRADRTPDHVAADRDRNAAHQVASRAARTSEQVAAQKARGAARYNERNLKLEEETRAAAALHAEQLGFLGAFDTQRKISERLIISEKLLRESCKPRVELERIADAMFSTRVQVRN